MTAASRTTLSDRMRLPVALGIAGLMITGTTAMAWPVLKTAFVPVTAPAVAPADPAAVSGFVEMTRTQASPAQVAPALAAPLEIPAPTLAQMTRAPSAEVTTQEPETDIDLQTSQAQAQTPRPAPRPEPAPEPEPRTEIVFSDSESEPHPIVPRRAQREVPQVAPTIAQSNFAAGNPHLRERLDKSWSTGAFR